MARRRRNAELAKGLGLVEVDLSGSLKDEIVYSDFLLEKVGGDAIRRQVDRAVAL